MQFISTFFYLLSIFCRSSPSISSLRTLWSWNILLDLFICRCCWMPKTWILLGIHSKTLMLSKAYMVSNLIRKPFFKRKFSLILYCFLVGLDYYVNMLLYPLPHLLHANGSIITNVENNMICNSLYANQALWCLTQTQRYLTAENNSMHHYNAFFALCYVWYVIYYYFLSNCQSVVDYLF